MTYDDWKRVHPGIYHAGRWRILRMRAGWNLYRLTDAGDAEKQANYPSLRDAKLGAVAAYVTRTLETGP